MVKLLAFRLFDWVTSNYMIRDLFINKYTSLISALRKDGWIIIKQKVFGTLFKYRIIGKGLPL